MGIINLNSILKNSDERGFLIEFLRGDENILNFVGQIYVSSFEPFTKRGDHFHKRRTEIFSVIKGKLVLHTFELESGLKEEIELSSESDKFQKIMIPPMTVHTFVNGDKNSLLLSYTDLIYDKSNTDTFNHVISI